MPIGQTIKLYRWERKVGNPFQLDRIFGLEGLHITKYFKLDSVRPDTVQIFSVTGYEVSSIRIKGVIAHIDATNFKFMQVYYVLIVKPPLAACYTARHWYDNLVSNYRRPKYCVGGIA